MDELERQQIIEAGRGHLVGVPDRFERARRIGAELAESDAQTEATNEANEDDNEEE